MATRWSQFKQWAVLLYQEKLRSRIQSSFQLRRNGGRIGVFLIFLIIAALLWYLSKLNHDYTIDLNYPIKLESHPPGKLLVGDSIRHIPIRVRGQGYSLVKIKQFRNSTPLVVNLRDLARNFGTDQQGYAYLSAMQLEAIFARQMPQGVSIESVLVDSIRCQFSPLQRSKLPVSLARLYYAISSQHLLASPIKIAPDSVWASGPKATINAMKEIPIDSTNLGQLYAPRYARLRLDAPQGVEYDKETVTAFIDVRQYTEATFEVPIKATGLGDSLQITLIPTHATIVCNVPLNMYEAIRATDFALEARIPRIPMGQKIPIILKKKPDFAFNLSFSPQYVQYIIERK